MVSLLPPLFRSRILAFSESPITEVHVSIDGEPVGRGHSAGGPLYVLLWDPSLYLTGLHTVRVKVEVRKHDDDGYVQ